MTKEEKLNQMLVDHCCVDPDKIRLNATLEELGCDSLDCVELGMQIDEDYNLQLADDAITVETTVQQLYELVPATA